MVKSADKGKSRGRGRPAGPPYLPKTVNVQVSHLRYLDALANVASGGKPLFTAQVAQALERFIKSELAKPGVQAAVDQYIKKNRHLVLREVTKP